MVRELASAGDNGLVRTWVSDTGTPVDTFAGHAGPVSAVAFTPAGVLSAAAEGGTIVWNTAPSWTLERTIGNTNDLSDVCRPRDGSGL